MIEVRDYLAKKYHVKILDHEAWEESGREGKTLHLGTNQTILWLNKPPVTPSSIGTLAHEAIHAIDQIYQTMGVPFSAENDEIRAYAVEHVVEEVLKDFQKHA